MENSSPQPEPRRPTRLSSIIARITALGFPSAIAGHLPSHHWIVDLPASFPVQAGATLLVGAAVLFLARRHVLGLVWFSGFAAAALAVVPGWWDAAASRGASRGEPLSVMTLNLARGNEQNADRALRTIRDAGPDVVLLTEVTPRWFRKLAPGMVDYPHNHVTTDPGYFGIALYSRLPLTSVATIPLAYDWAPAIRAVVDTGDGPVGVLGVHTPRPGRGERCAERDAALAAIPTALAGLPERQIVLGDFNATPWNRAFRDMLEITGLRNVTGDTFRPTWPMSFPWPLRVPIDHVLAHDAIGAEDVAVGSSFGSDHAPLLVRLRL